jgi:hypothetical protein
MPNPMPPPPDPKSGILRFEGDIIRYLLPNGGFTLRLSDIRIIGECTNQDGPFADDYFLCFVTAPNLWYEASFYAAGRDEFLAALGERLGVPLQLALQASTDFASRILWPADLAGQPRFDYRPERPTGTWSWLRSKLSPRVHRTLSPKALTLL